MSTCAIRTVAGGGEPVAWRLVLAELAPAGDQAFDVRGAVLLAPGAALVWDTLTRPSDMAGVAAILGDRAVTVVYSHADWDHCWGTAGLRGAHKPAAIVAHPLCLQRFETELPSALADLRGAEPDRWDEVILAPPTRTIATSGPGALKVGGLRVELHPLPGHTADSLVAWLPELGVLLAGDVVEEPCPTVGDPEAVRSWAVALEAWAARDDLRHVIPGHGPIGGRELLVGTAEYLRRLGAGAWIALPAGTSDFYVGVHASNVALMTRG